jgi:hypothetical protein
VGRSRRRQVYTGSAIAGSFDRGDDLALGAPGADERLDQDLEVPVVVKPEVCLDDSSGLDGEDRGGFGS